MKKKNINLDILEMEGTFENKVQDSKESISESDIAIIGISARIMDLEEKDALWKNGLNGQSALSSEFPEERFHEIKEYLIRQGIKNPKPDMFMPRTYFEDISYFDAKFFQVLPNDAVMMDPAQRIMLEQAWNVLQDAGYSQKSVDGSDTGVFIGYSPGEHNYQNLMEEYDKEMYEKNIAGTVNSVIASRISYYFNLKGPALMIDSACSSSLSAVHAACQSLLSGECKMAFAGGVKYYLIPEKQRKEEEVVSVVSMNGITRTFDNRADGTTQGEGTAMVLLKTLRKAQADKDHIYAVIKASAVNQDGASVGITAPNSKAQKEVICTAWEKAQLNPESITYIEAHGTATKLGDPVEVTGIDAAFRKYTNRKNFCAVSSVKSVIGHLDSAAGILGLIRCVLALKNKQIPGSLHFHEPNKKIDFIDSAVYVNDSITDWNAQYPRRAGVSSFGISGTNSHVVVEEAPLRERREKGISPYLLTLSLKEKKAEDLLFERMEQYLCKTDERIEDICYTAHASRSEFYCRYAFVFETKEELIGQIKGVRSKKEGSCFYNDCKAAVNTEEGKRFTEEARAVMAKLAKQEEEKERRTLLEKLAQAYIKGAEVEWEQFPYGTEVRKTALPAYPYCKQRYFVEPKEQMLQVYKNKEYDMLIGRKIVDSLDIVIFENEMSIQTHTELKEHRIGNTHVLAGTVYVEMIQRAMEEITGNGSMEIQNLVFQMPMTCDTDKVRLIHMVVQSEEGQYKISIQSTYKGEQNWTKHVSAGVVQMEYGAKKVVDISKEEARIRSMQKEKAEKSSTEGLVKVGPRWNPEKEIIASDTEVFVSVKVPDAYAEELHKYHIYPPMLDASVNAGSILNGANLYLPYYFGKIRIYQRMPVQCVSLLKKKGEDTKEAEITSFDGKILDTEGNLIAEVEHYSMKRTHEKERKQFMGQADARYHMLYWEKDEPQEREGKKKTSLESCVIVRTEAQSEDSLYKAIKKQCKTHTAEIILSDKKGILEQEKTFILQENEQEYEACFEKLREEKLEKNIIYLPGKIAENAASIEELKRQYKSRLKGLYYILRVLSGNKQYSDINLFLITKDAVAAGHQQAAVCAVNTMLLGMGKAAMLENSRIHVKCIDTDSQTEERKILEEIEDDTVERIVAYRQNERYTQYIGESGDDVKEETVNVKSEGVYFITGGLGGAGMALANKLAEKNPHVNLALVNRSVFPPKEEWKEILAEQRDEKMVKKIEQIQKMEAGGATIEIFSADVSQEDKMNEIFAYLREKYNVVNGIIHTAGLPGGGLLMRKDWSAFEKVLYPKVEGTWILNHLTQEDKLDFFAVFSSYSSVLCEVGQTDYIVANSYLDGFCYQEQQTEKNIVTLNWTGWGESGMAVDNQVEQGEGTLKFMNNQEAAQAFMDALAREEKQVLIGEYDYRILAQEEKQEKIMKYLKFNKDIENKLKKYRSKDTDRKRKEVQVLGKTTGKLTETEQKVANIWGSTLGIIEIEYDAKFLEIGGDSLSATYLQKELEKEYPGVMDITDVFVYSSVCEMAKYIDSQIRPKKVEEKKVAKFDTDLVELLKMVSTGQMKVEEANKLL